MSRKSIALIAALAFAAVPGSAASASSPYTVGAASGTFTDAASIQGMTRVLVSVDEATSSLALPFALTFAGKRYPAGSTIHVTSNGVIEFGAANGAFASTCLPDAAMGPAIMAFWDDLITRAGGVAYATTGVAPNRKLIVTFEDATRFATTTNQTFTVSIAEATNAIDINYLTMSGSNATGAAAVVGVQDGAAGFTQHGCQTAGIANSGTGIGFYPAWPEPQIMAGPSGPTSDATPSFTFTAAQGATFECRVDSQLEADFQACNAANHDVGSTTEGGFTTPGLGDGGHTFEVRGTTTAAGTGPPTSRAFTVDTDVPAVTLDPSGPTGKTVADTAAFSFTSGASDLDHFECRLDALAFEACTSPREYAALADGPHAFEVHAVDEAGNAGAATRAWTVDTTPPQTTIGSGPSGLTADSSPTFAFAAGEAGSSFECRLDSAQASAFVHCQTPATFPGLADGAHTLEVRARDGVGNTDPTPAVRRLTVDTRAPTASLTGVRVRSAKRKAALSFASDEPGSTFACKLDAKPRLPCTSPRTYKRLKVGRHTFLVDATDRAGNRSPAAVRKFRVK